MTDDYNWPMLFSNLHCAAMRIYIRYPFMSENMVCLWGTEVFMVNMWWYSLSLKMASAGEAEMFRSSNMRRWPNSLAFNRPGHESIGAQLRFSCSHLPSPSHQKSIFGCLKQSPNETCLVFLLQFSTENVCRGVYRERDLGSKSENLFQQHSGIRFQ